MKRLATWLLTLSVLTIAGLTWQGCSDSSTGKVVGPNQTSNFSVENTWIKTVHVYIDGGEVGQVPPGQTVDFYVNPGVREVLFRERGDTVQESQGVFTFDTTTTVRLVHDPSVTFNLQVTNNKNLTTHVFVGLQEEGEVQPGTTRTFRVDSGPRDVHFRDRGDPTADYFGTFNFNTTTVVTIDYP